MTILAVIGSQAIFTRNQSLVDLLGSTTFSDLYIKAQSKNSYLIALGERQRANKFVERHQLIKAFELTPKMTTREKIAGYKLISVYLLSCDTRKTLLYNLIGLAALLEYIFTGNFLIFTNLVWALVQLIKEGRISKAVAKTRIMLINKKGIRIPKELEDAIS